MADKRKLIHGEIVVTAGLGDVWNTWTTEVGAKTFFAPECKIDFRPGGAYEMYFSLELPYGLRGGEGCLVLAIQPMEMFSFTWNAPPNLTKVRNQYTHVQVWLVEEVSNTRVILTHDGWGAGGEWDKAFAYFKQLG